MDPDNYQQVWQAHASQARVAIDPDSLLKEVQLNQRKFRATIFWRDFREIGIALLLVPLWIYLGSASPSWTWYLAVPALVWMVGFMLVYRVRHKQELSQPDEPLLHCVQRSLTEIDDQIWLLRNVFWWYLLPPGISIMAFIAHVTWLKSKGWWDSLILSPLFLFVLVLYYFLDRVNQYAVRTQLEPRRQELLALLASFGDKPTHEC